MDYKNLKAGQIAELFAIAFAFVLVIVGVVYVCLPILNTGLITQPGYNASNTSQCLTNCGSANLTGYPGGSGIGTATYILTALALLAGAAMFVSGLLGGRL